MCVFRLVQFVHDFNVKGLGAARRRLNPFALRVEMQLAEYNLEIISIH